MNEKPLTNLIRSLRLDLGRLEVRGFELCLDYNSRLRIIHEVSEHNQSYRGLSPDTSFGYEGITISPLSSETKENARLNLEIAQRHFMEAKERYESYKK